MSICDLSALAMHPKADDAFVVAGQNYRFTVLTPQILRLEYSKDGVFEDRATRLALNRAFDTPRFESYTEDGWLHIVTDYLHLIYDKKPFSETGLQITVKATARYQQQYWFYGRAVPANYGGTVRTLDGVNGAIPLPDGLIGRTRAFSVLDDSNTIALGEDGWPVPVGGNGRIDLYFFGNSQSPEACVRDFYRLSGAVPLFPRYALGNWWSRYHKYSADEYLALLDRFESERIPLAVGILDMDWHITAAADGVRKWTGFTWNEKLFPDRVAFLAELHRRGLSVALNLHPRDGIGADEKPYAPLCEALGRPQDGRAVEFDVSDRAFLSAYFEKVLHPLEEEGVDFWWLDWQQPSGSRKPGYDALWMLNHSHFTDGTRDGRRSLCLSRFAGIGSHRYPIGFSGDTVISWESLAFQPYFTATASNVGFSWWSHDIGGFKPGIRDAELYTRWVELGVFSPIMRLHAAPSPDIAKEPWKWGAEAGTITAFFLRLRHRLIPYLFTMMYRNHEEGIPLVRPMYHTHPGVPAASEMKNEYWFGSSLIAAPITQKRDVASGLATSDVWLPDGLYIDFFSSRIYSGGRKLRCYRPLDSFPLFVTAGAILPLADDAVCDRTDNPEAFELRVYGGADGRFVMVEDNGKGAACEVCRTAYEFSYGEHARLTIRAPKATEGVPTQRRYTVRFVGFTTPSAVSVGDTPVDFTYDEPTRTVTVAALTVNEDSVCRITVDTDGKLPENEQADACDALLERMSGVPALPLEHLRRIMRKPTSAAARAAEVCCEAPNESLKGALLELLGAN